MNVLKAAYLFTFYQFLHYNFNQFFTLILNVHYVYAYNHKGKMRMYQPPLILYRLKISRF